MKMKHKTVQILKEKRKIKKPKNEMKKNFDLCQTG